MDNGLKEMLEGRKYLFRGTLDWDINERTSNGFYEHPAGKFSSSVNLHYALTYCKSAKEKFPYWKGINPRPILLAINYKKYPMQIGNEYDNEIEIIGKVSIDDLIILNSLDKFREYKKFDLESKSFDSLTSCNSDEWFKRIILTP